MNNRELTTVLRFDNSTQSFYFINFLVIDLLNVSLPNDMRVTPYLGIQLS